ncbi:DUF4865 family protein [Pantoea septica]|uniref:DUF4865 family protein n=1 Tax=Pantoea septica TaxID=472695 RepID=UPI00289EF1AF|nr:DUF4865 family protein [Pantoea septica]
MILMHYRFTLPADYDMAIIERRIAENGAKLDGFPDLIFKAYLYARRDEGARTNSYAPLYLWRDSAGIIRFLQSAGFARLTEDFGCPVIQCWLGVKTPPMATLCDARFAALRHRPVAPCSDLTAINVEGALVGWDISAQSLLQVDFAADEGLSGECYRIGYLALGEPTMRNAVTS